MPIDTNPISNRRPCWPVCVTLLVVLAIQHNPAPADETLYRYEGDIHLLEPSTGWVIADPCEAPCTESVQDGHFVLHWPEPGDRANYNLEIGREPETPPPPTLWVEWRFRSNHPVGPVWTGCDASFRVDYKEIVETIEMYGDATISFDGGSVVTGLDIDAFHTYRFETLDGIGYTFAVDGQVFFGGQTGQKGNFLHALQLRGRNSCASDNIPNKINETDFVRYGTIGFGERVVSADPPAGLLDPVQHADLDRFAITFDAPNFAYIDDIIVLVTAGLTPVITQTWRRENDEPDTLEVVLDAPLNTSSITRFIITDGVSTSVVEYTYGAGDFGACCQADGFCTSQTETGCGLIPDATFLGVGSECAGDADECNPDSACGEFNGVHTVDLEDISIFVDCISGPGLSVTLACEPADMDADADADLSDFAILQSVFGCE